MIDWMMRPLKQYATFSGRAQRAEYWYFVLFVLIGVFAASFVDAALGSSRGGDPGVLASVFVLAVIVPSVAVAARRLHDIGRSGWWQLINIVPLVGPIVLLVMLTKDSDPGDNRYGPNPKQGSAAGAPGAVG